MIRGAWALLVVAAAASAQQSPAPADPVVANFRAYRAALARDDLPAAETAAAAALAASEAARGSRTAVLALNLANLRLELGRDYDALTPARTAHALATSGAESGVDPRLAALTLGRAAIASGERDGARRLAEAIAAAQTDEALASDVYGAAVELGQWALDAQDYATAEHAWASAERLAAASSDPTFARANALIGKGAAIFLRHAYPQELQTGARTARISTPDAQAASDAFTLAQRLLEKTAYAATPAGTTLTAGQVAFAQAMAWQGALHARIESLDEPLPVPLPPGLPGYDSSGDCVMRSANTGPEIEYATPALFRFGVGAAVAHFALNADGTIRARTLAASIPPGALGDSVEATLGEWRIEKDPRSPTSCRVPPSYYVMVRFILE